MMSIVVFLATLAIAGSAIACGKGKHENKTCGIQTVKLSPELKALLAEEMRALETGMSSLIHEIVSGQWGNIETIALSIRDSYIMRKKLTKEQIGELKGKLPEQFKGLDQEFHKSAGMLAHVAKKKNRELVAFYYYKLTDACMNCHSKYATEKFPGLVIKDEAKAHSH